MRKSGVSADEAIQVEGQFPEIGKSANGAEVTAMPGLSEVLAMLGQKWTASIIRRLYAGFSRFNAISRELGVNPNTLKARLDDLQAVGIVVRIVESSVPLRTRYELTGRGVALAKIVVLLQEWASGDPYPGA